MGRRGTGREKRAKLQGLSPAIWVQVTPKAATENLQKRTQKSPDIELPWKCNIRNGFNLSLHGRWKYVIVSLIAQPFLIEHTTPPSIFFACCPMSYLNCMQQISMPDD